MDEDHKLLARYNHRYQKRNDNSPLVLQLKIERLSVANRRYRHHTDSCCCCLALCIGFCISINFFVFPSNSMEFPRFHRNYCMKLQKTSFQVDCADPRSNVAPACALDNIQKQIHDSLTTQRRVQTSALAPVLLRALSPPLILTALRAS
jgi:hypothetical protein